MILSLPFSILGIDSCIPAPGRRIIARSDGCSAVSRGSVSYTCKNTDSIVWKSDIFEPIFVIGSSETTQVSNFSVTGVTVAENNTYNDCLKSTLTFSGSLENLQRLNKELLRCEKIHNVTIVVPSELLARALD